MMWRLQSGPSEKEVVSEMFQTFDDNFMGFIGVDELRNLFRKANAESGGRIEVRRAATCNREHDDS